MPSPQASKPEPDSARDAATITLDARLPARLLQPGAATIVGSSRSEAAGGESSREGAGPTSTARYLIIDEVGQGGMALVHSARDTELLRKVAIKSMADSIKGDAGMRARFLREVQITAQLEHPHVVPVYSLEAAAQGEPAYTMKLIEGCSFEQYLRDTAASYECGRSPDEAHDLPTRLEHFLKVCDAIAYAHDKGVVHRDLKPANVMIGRHNEVYVMDWGICRLLGESGGETQAASASREHNDPGQTQDGLIVGTPGYMAPEQAQGRNEAIGPHSDQCALGLMLFELVTLRAPFAGLRGIDVLLNAARSELQPMHAAYPGMPVPRELRAIVARATASEPTQRYTSVRAFAADIRRYLHGEAVLARPDNLWQRTARFLSRHRQATLLGLFALVAAAATAISVLLWQQERSQRAAYEQDRYEAALLEKVARHGDRLQTRLLILQGELDALAMMAGKMLTHGRDSDQQLYWLDDFQREGGAPPDFGPQPGYAQAVSLQHGVWTATPNVSREALINQAQRLANLRLYADELFEHAQATSGRTNGRESLAAHQSTGEFLVALESGLGYHYPGLANLKADREFRQQPWYQGALKSPRAHWERAPADELDGTVNLRISHAIRAPGSPQLGAIALALRMDEALLNLGSNPAFPGLRALALLDENGDILTATSTLALPGGTDLASPATPVRFPEPALFEALRQRDIGLLRSEVFGHADLIAFDRIDPFGWVVLAIVDDATRLPVEASLRSP